ncbi:hypothetical protein NDU88_005869 [Pleurodeles waltl]|uniref:Uncharacterized protein n=1 Tax=Pleurodeles waltl TaxID=8319 RepID=A0AAV7TV65_PLEWA|nr:hypothetical protein NDU88_005869 [Pleurodeles waltl]
MEARQQRWPGSAGPLRAQRQSGCATGGPGVGPCDGSTTGSGPGRKKHQQAVSSGDSALLTDTEGVSRQGDRRASKNIRDSTRGRVTIGAAKRVLQEGGSKREFDGMEGEGYRLEGSRSGHTEGFKMVEERVDTDAGDGGLQSDGQEAEEQGEESMLSREGCLDRVPVGTREHLALNILQKPGNTYPGNGVKGYLQALEWSDEEEGEERRNQCQDVDLGVRTGEDSGREIKLLNIYLKKKELGRGVDVMDSDIHSEGLKEGARPARLNTTAGTIDLMHVFQTPKSSNDKDSGVPDTSPRLRGEEKMWPRMASQTPAMDVNIAAARRPSMTSALGQGASHCALAEREGMGQQAPEASTQERQKKTDGKEEGSSTGADSEAR